MSTWQMFSDAGNTFRWEISQESAEPNGALAQQPSQPPHSPLPSMADLLLQGTLSVTRNLAAYSPTYTYVSLFVLTPNSR